jgi:hypothetical protein
MAALPAPEKNEVRKDDGNQPRKRPLILGRATPEIYPYGSLERWLRTGWVYGQNGFGGSRPRPRMKRGEMFAAWAVVRGFKAARPARREATELWDKDTMQLGLQR